MVRKKLTMWGIPLAMAAFGPLASEAQEAQEVHRLAGEEVAIYNLAGEVRVLAGSGREVVVRVTRGGGDAARLRVEAGTEAGRATLRVRYPDGGVVYPALGRGSRTSVQVGADGTFWDGVRGRAVEIRGSGRGSEAWADLVVEVPRGTRVSMFLAAGPAEARGVDAELRLRTGVGNVRASNTAGRLQASTGSGSISVSHARGAVDLATGSGSVTVEGMEGSEVGVKTGSGGVRGSGLNSRTVWVDTGSGSVRLDGVAAPDVRVATGSGSVELTLLRDVDRLLVATGSGAVTVHAVEDLGGVLDLATGSGTVDVDFPVLVSSARRTRLAGTIGDGRGTIRISTGSGRIRLLGP